MDASPIAAASAPRCVPPRPSRSVVALRRSALADRSARRRHSSLRVAGLAAGLALAALRPAAGQVFARPLPSPDSLVALPAPALEPLAAVLRDADGDHLPDRLGARVRVRGLLVSPARTAIMGSFPVRALHAESHGVMLADPYGRLAELPAGTVVDLVGVVDSFFGTEELVVETAVARGTARYTPPLVPPGAVAADSLAGRMVRVRGQLHFDEREGVASGFHIDDDAGRVQIYVPVGVRDVPDFPLGLDDAGRRVELVGLVGQYDREPPLDGGLQLILLDPATVHVSGLAPGVVRRFALILSLGILLGALGALGVTTLRQRARLHDLRRLTTIDPMTGLLNRAGYEQAVAQALGPKASEDAGAALVLVDLDDFKQVNDRLGHLVGDHVLREVARRLRELVPPEDGVVCRYGGDEFAIVLDGPAARDAGLLAQRIVDWLRLVHVQPNESRIGVTLGASVGVSVVDPLRGGPTSPESLLASADAALYEGKRAGKGRARMARSA